MAQTFLISLCIIFYVSECLCNSSLVILSINQSHHIQLHQHPNQVHLKVEIQVTFQLIHHRKSILFTIFKFHFHNCCVCHNDIYDKYKNGAQVLFYTPFNIFKIHLGLFKRLEYLSNIGLNSSSSAAFLAFMASSFLEYLPKAWY